MGRHHQPMQKQALFGLLDRPMKKTNRTDQDLKATAVAVPYSPAMVDKGIIHHTGTQSKLLNIHRGKEGIGLPFNDKQ